MRSLSFILSLALLLTGTFTSGYAQSISSSSDSIVPNSGFEAGKSKWVTSGGTFSVITDSTVAIGKVSGRFVCSSIGQFLESTLASVPAGLQNGNGQLSFRYKNGLGVKVSLRDASALLAEAQVVNSASAWNETNLNLVFPSSVKVRFECTTATGSIDLDEVILGKNEKIIIIDESSPVGTVVSSMLTESQFQTERGTHWVLADGRNVAGTRFATLFGSSTLPDLRGRFLRGKNNGQTTALGNADGEINLGVFQSMDAYVSVPTSYANYAGPINAQYSSNASRLHYGDASPWQTNGTHTFGTETRPRNVTVNYFIKINDIAPVTVYKDSGFSLRAGQIITGAFAVCPVGTLEADGSAVSRALYPQLFQALGVSHGQGDGSTTFGIPDYRGRFLRGVDGAAGRDPDRASRTAMATGGNVGDAVGSVQSSMYASHNHQSYKSWSKNQVSGSSSGSYFWNDPSPSWPYPTPTYLETTYSGGNETRPLNVYVKYCVQTVNTNITGSFEQINEMRAYKEITSSYTASKSDSVISYNNSTDSTLTLPSASIVGAGKVFTINSIGGGMLTVTRSGSDTIEGGITSFKVSGSATISDSVKLASTGTGWIFLDGTATRRESCHLSVGGYNSSDLCTKFVASLSNINGWFVVSVNFKTGIFSTMPSCTSTVSFGGYADRGTHNWSISTGAYVVRTFVTSNNGNEANPFTIQCTGKR